MNFFFLLPVLAFSVGHIALAEVSAFGHKVLIDAGSTGSRVYVYKYDRVSPWSTVSELAHKRLHPALSAFVNDYDGLVKQMEVFIRFAKYYIEDDEWQSTDISLKATAGLRAISNENQSSLIHNVRKVLQTSGFRFNPTDTRVISGQEEAMYGFLAVNAAYATPDEVLTIGAADLGGSSTQISFMIPPRFIDSDDSEENKEDNEGHEDVKVSKKYNFGDRSGCGSATDCTTGDAFLTSCTVDYELPLLSAIAGVHSNRSNSSGDDSTVGSPKRRSKIFARSVNGLGLISAMEAVIDKFLNMSDGALDTDADLDDGGGKPYRSSDAPTVALHQPTHGGGGAGWQQHDRRSSASRLHRDSTAAPCPAATAEIGTDSHTCTNSHDSSRSGVDSWSNSNTSNTSNSNTSRHSRSDHALSASISNDTIWLNPCISPGTPFPYLQGGLDIELYGSGDFGRCVALVNELLAERAGNESACMQRVRPKVIIGMDNLPKVLEIMHLATDAPVSPHAVRLAGEEICRRSWSDVIVEFPTFMPYRAQRACFGASYVYALLRTLYGLEEYDETTFLPLEYHGEYTLGWPLGATIFSAIGLEASDLMQPLLGTTLLEAEMNEDDKSVGSSGSVGDEL